MLYDQHWCYVPFLLPFHPPSSLSFLSSFLPPPLLPSLLPSFPPPSPPSLPPPLLPSLLPSLPPSLPPPLLPSLLPSFPPSFLPFLIPSSSLHPRMRTLVQTHSMTWSNMYCWAWPIYIWRSSTMTSFTSMMHLLLSPQGRWGSVNYTHVSIVCGNEIKWWIPIGCAARGIEVTYLVIWCRSNNVCSAWSSAGRGEVV